MFYFRENSHIQTSSPLSSVSLICFFSTDVALTELFEIILTPSIKIAILKNTTLHIEPNEGLVFNQPIFNNIN